MIVDHLRKISLLMGTPKSLHDTVPNRQQIVVNKGGVRNGV
jgi:hypothetical protein